MARILCVDDEPACTCFYVLLMERFGHSARAAMSAHEGTEKLQNNDFDLVITGWNLDDAKGDVVIKAAKSKKIPVIVISGYAQEARQLADPQADLYLEKPSGIEELLTAVNSLLNGLSPLS
jgi:DNA-binding response OmpR family regulator